MERNLDDALSKFSRAHLADLARILNGGALPAEIQAELDHPTPQPDDADASAAAMAAIESKRHLTDELLSRHLAMGRARLADASEQRRLQETPSGVAQEARSTISDRP